MVTKGRCEGMKNLEGGDGSDRSLIYIVDSALYNVGGGGFCEDCVSPRS